MDLRSPRQSQDPSRRPSPSKATPVEIPRTLEKTTELPLRPPHNLLISFPRKLSPAKASQRKIAADPLIRLQPRLLRRRQPHHDHHHPSSALFCRHPTLSTPPAHPHDLNRRLSIAVDPLIRLQPGLLRRQQPYHDYCQPTSTLFRCHPTLPTPRAHPHDLSRCLSISQRPICRPSRPPNHHCPAGSSEKIEVVGVVFGFRTGRR